MAKKVARKCVWWPISDELVRVQVSISDRKNFEVIKRSRKTVAVGNVFRAGSSDEVIFDTTPAALAEMNITATKLVEKRARKQKVDKLEAAADTDALVAKVPLRDQIAIALALLPTGTTFNARELKVGGSIATVRMVLGAMAKAGTIASEPKVGYRKI